MAAPSSGSSAQPAPLSSQLSADARTDGGVDADPSYALATTALRTGLSVIAAVAATDCLFALAAGEGATAAVRGIVLTGLGIGGVIRTDIAV